LISGKLWGRNNNRNLNTQIITTTATIGIRGTEYMIEASENASTVSIQEGEVVAENERGQTIVRSGEQVVTRAGQAPQRSTLVQSAAAVQWTIQVPELIDLQVLLKKGIKDRSIVKKIEQAYRQSNYATALDLLAQEQRRQPDSSAIQLVRAWIHIKAGNSVGVFPRLKTLSTQYPGDASLQEMMAFSAFLNTQYADARNIIQQLQQRNQLTDTGWVVSAYLHQAAYDLVAAEQAYLKALEINPTSQPAQLQLATLYFASEQNQRALAMVSQLAASNPNFVSASNLKGFILLANNETANALAEWEQSEKAGVADAETYFGLSLAYMRKGLIEQAMQSIASAVLLDPQRSMYLSYWGKMLHQIGRNDKALTVLDSAIRLDQQDPTPRLYKAIILRDLNRPGEAIRHLQVAQELNNNRGVYRSRSLLDKDLAVQNVDLSRLFTQLGLAEWAHKKAINSIKSDFTNVSAHILNAGAYAGVGDRAYALANEALLARLMQPANINAFSSFNSYTSLYETPDNEFNLELSAGNHQQRSASLIAAGAVPEKSLAWSVAAVHDGSDGWRNTNGESFDNLSFIGKWQLNEKANLLISASVTDSEFMYDFNLPRYEIDSTDDNKPPFNIGTKELELGLHYRLSNDHDLMFYISGNDFNGGQNGLEIDPFNIGASILTLETVYKDSYERPSTRFQFQGIKKLKQHQLIYGLLFYNGMNNAHINEDATI